MSRLTVLTRNFVGQFLFLSLSFGVSMSLQSADWQVTRLVDQLRFPWSLAFLSADEWLIAERDGRLWRITAAGQRTEISGLPNHLVATGQGGLFDVVLHPQFSDNQLIYLAYAGRDAQNRSNTEIARARLRNNRLVDLEVIFTAQPKVRGGRHFGGKLLFDAAGYLYLGLGDRGDTPRRAQDLTDHSGSLIRLHDDGRVPVDNPFVDQSPKHPEIYTYGNRNIQGLAMDSETGEIWMHEHGPLGGDEVNRVIRGANYGWPIVTHGREYSGAIISELTSAPGMVDPLKVWSPSIAPSGLVVYRGTAFPQWNGHFFVGALRGQRLVRLTLENQRLVEAEAMLVGQLGRIREVRQGPDDFIYLLTDSPNGALYQISPR